MAGWNLFKKKRQKWGLAVATEQALHALQQGEATDDPYPLKADVSRPLQKGFVGVRDRWIIALSETAPGEIHLSMSDIGERRESQLTLDVSSEAELIAGVESWRSRVAWWQGRLSVYRLQPGRTYRILQTFTDFYGSVFEVGRELIFESWNFVPYHGGHTLAFRSTSIYLQEDNQSDILWKFDLYFEELLTPT